MCVGACARVCVRVILGTCADKWELEYMNVVVFVVMLLAVSGWVACWTAALRPQPFKTHPMSGPTTPFGMAIRFLRTAQHTGRRFARAWDSEPTPLPISPASKGQRIHWLLPAFRVAWCGCSHHRFAKLLPNNS
mmetsp:Transcript_7280/g.11964  ORF Transcript_7280/g.11964 Transcript_7280/m.11964 type:complete len:134 (+) Transcript_7280:3-404(+)